MRGGTDSDLAQSIGVLFVCTGNICRSPTAEGVFTKLHAELAPQLKLRIESAGTHAYHVGETPDERAVRAARKRGIDIRGHRGRTVIPADFKNFDYILAMDRTNLRYLHALRPHPSRASVQLMLKFARDCTTDEVPDPYYRGLQGFEEVLDLVEQGGRGLLHQICDLHGVPLSAV